MENEKVILSIGKGKDELILPVEEEVNLIIRVIMTFYLCMEYSSVEKTFVKRLKVCSMRCEK